MLRRIYQYKVKEFLGDLVSLMLVCLQMYVTPVSLWRWKLGCFEAKIGAL